MSHAQKKEVNSRRIDEHNGNQISIAIQNALKCDGSIAPGSCQAQVQDQDVIPEGDFKQDLEMVRSGLVQIWMNLQLKFNSLKLNTEVGRLF